MTDPDPLRVAAQRLFDAALDSGFPPEEIDPESSYAQRVTLRGRDLDSLRAALAADAARPTYEATLVLELLDRAVLTTEDETEWREHSEGIRAAIQEGGLTLAIRRQLDFEATLDDNDGYGPFPASLAARLTEDRP